MSEVVFLSNTNIQIASGSSSAGGVKVSRLFSAPLPEGAVLNGVVMDQDVVIDTIKNAWSINKLPKSEVTLIINSPQLRANRVDAPLLNDKKTTEFISRETSNAEYGRFQSPVTGWYLVGRDKKAKTQKIVYERAESEFVTNYVSIFEKAGLKLKSIHNGVQLATEFFTRGAAGKTVIYMILDGKSLVTIFFANGKYYYDQTSRVFSQPGTPEFAREIYTSISSIRQFMSAQHLTETVRDILFAGITQPQVTQLSNDILNIDSQLEVSVVTAPQGTSIADGNVSFPFFVYPIAGLRKLDEKLPILKASKQSSSQAEGGKSSKKLIIPFIAVLAILAVIYGILTFITISKKSELKKLQDYINDPKVIKQVNEYDAMYNQMADMGKIQGGVDMLNEDLASYPLPNSEINKKILAAAAVHDVEIGFKTYSSASGVFSVTASSPVVDDINMFIADLMSMDIFQNVDYTGYTLSDDGTKWQINVVCTLASPDTGTDSGTGAESAEEVN